MEVQQQPEVDRDQTGRPDVQPSRRTGRRVLLAALAVLALLLAAVVGYGGYLNHLLSSNVAHADLLPGGPVPTDANAARAGVADLGGDYPASSLPVRLPDTGTNILVIGSDKEAAGEGWSDVILLAHINQQADQVLVVRLPRDLYVTVPGHGQDKLRTAYTVGGAKLLVESVQNLFGVAVDHVAVTGFAGFRSMTDAVGGVDVQVTEPGQWPGYAFEPGVMHMDGETALAFVRERSGGDLSRGTRQQAFFTALMGKSMSRGQLTNPLAMAALVRASTENLTVDNEFTPGQMRSLAFGLRGLRSGDVSFVPAPVSGTANPTPDQTVLLVDVPRMRALGDAVRQDQLTR